VLGNGRPLELKADQVDIASSRRGKLMLDYLLKDERTIKTATGVSQSPMISISWRVCG